MRDGTYHIIAEREFQQWLEAMGDAIAGLLGRLPRRVVQSLDYSLRSLSVLEAWLLEQYSDLDRLIDDREVLDGATRYVGETIRRLTGARWSVDLDDDSARFGYPMVEIQGTVPAYPSTWVTASINRKRGNYMETFISKVVERFRKRGDATGTKPLDEKSSDLSYGAIIYVEDESDFTMGRAAEVLRSVDGVTSVEALDEQHIVIMFGDFRFVLGLEDEPYVEDDIRDVFETADKSDPLVERAIKCKRRLTLWSDEKDADMDHFNDYVLLLGRLLDSFSGLIAEDHYTGEWI